MAADRAAEHPPGREDIPCVVDDPVWLEPVIRGVGFVPGRIEAAPQPMLASCSLALALDWMSQMLAEAGVVTVVHLGSYGCRFIAGTDILSEHARARALDVAAVRRVEGSVYTVSSDWEQHQPVPATAAGAFLRQLVSNLFEAGVFNIVLTPDFNADHHDHFHLDLTPGVRLYR